MQVLNIPVPPGLLERWRGWLAPERQPFFLTGAEARALNLPTVPRAEAVLTPQERDTNTVWAVPAGADRVAWLTPAEWAALPQRTQRDLLRLQVRHGRGNVPLGQHYADLLPGLQPGRFLWTPGHLTPEVLARVVGRGQAPCQRAEVPEGVWAQAQSVLPRARELAGTFSTGPGNCFGTVMGAAGVPNAENEWMQREPFEAFLAKRSRPGGQDDRSGTLLVWRSERGIEHAAVTLGGGWALHKPAQTWWTPRVVRPVRDLIRDWRTPGQRLTRATLR